MLNNIGLIVIKNADIMSLLITIFGFYLAYFIYLKNNTDKKKQLKKIIRSQIDAIGPWVDSTGDGYGNTLTSDQKFDNANPSKLVFNTVEDPLINTSLIEEISNVPKEVTNAITELIYDLNRVKSIQSFRNLLISSDTSIAIEIKRDIDLYKANSPDGNYLSFLRSYDRRNARNFEKYVLITWLVNYAETMHCTIIGNKNRGARKHWEKINKWLEEQGEVKIDYTFVFITFISSLLCIEILSYLIFPITFLFQNQFLIFFTSTIISIFSSTIFEDSKQ